MPIKGIRPSPACPLQGEIPHQLHDLGKARPGDALTIAKDLRVDSDIPTPLRHCIIMVSIVQLLQLSADLLPFLPLECALNGADKQLGSFERAVILLFRLH